jgi:cell division protein FtsI/penicillin-binding protein 2
MKRVRNYASPCRVNGRILFIKYAGLLAFCLVVAKLFILQFVWHEKMMAKADRQFHGTTSITASRGSISDRNGRIAAVDLSYIYRLVCDTRIIYSPDSIARTLAPLMGIKKSKILKRLDIRMGQVRIVEGLGEDQAREIRDLNLRGVLLEQTGRRCYPYEDVAGNLLGVFNSAGKSINGLEEYYDSKLRGTDGLEYHLRTPSGIEHSSSNRPRQEAKPGSDLELFVDLRLQTAATEELQIAMKKWDAKAGMVVVLDPKNGEVLALVSLPGMNPNSQKTYNWNDVKLRSVMDQFDPGSTMKLVTYTAAIESGAIPDMDEKIFCHNGKYKVRNTTIHDSNKEGYDTLSVAEIFSNSSNIGTVKIAERMSKEDLYIMQRNFGVGSRSGIDVPNESYGALPGLGTWGDVEYANIAIGQGISVNALHVACAFGAVANDGLLIRPRVMRALNSGNGTEYSEALTVRRVMKKSTARQLKELLKQTVEIGTGKNATIEGVAVYGKTGTAQKFDKASNSYSKKDYMSSFAGFAEVHGRELVCFALLDSPRKAIYGGTVAAPVFKNVIQRAIELGHDYRSSNEALSWCVNNDEPVELVPQPLKSINMPDFTDLCLRDAVSLARVYSPDMKIAGSGKVKSQRPAIGVNKSNITTINLILN